MSFPEGEAERFNLMAETYAIGEPEVVAVIAFTKSGFHVAHNIPRDMFLKLISAMQEDLNNG